RGCTASACPKRTYARGDDYRSRRRRAMLTISSLDVDREGGKPPMLRAEPGGDAGRWVAGHRDALLAAVTEHGSLLIRGLGLRDAAETGTVFRQLGDLMTEKEAFAPRRSYGHRVYSSSKWPSNQPMCMHHELSYVL